AIASITHASQSDVVHENASSPPPKASVAYMMMRPRPTTDSRDARYKAPLNAPTPVAVIRRPSVLGPPFNTWAAIAGMSTVYGVPARLTMATSVRAERIGTEWKT